MFSAVVDRMIELVFEVETQLRKLETTSVLVCKSLITLDVVYLLDTGTGEKTVFMKLLELVANSHRSSLQVTNNGHQVVY